MKEFQKDTTARTEEIVAARLDKPVPFTLDAVLADYTPNMILRFRAAPGGAGDPSTVVVKRAKEPLGHLLPEIAGYAFLSQGETADLIPRIFGYDAGRELVVMEDLGAAAERQLGWILLGEDRARAETALMAFQRTLGRLHAGTAGREAAFLRIREGLGTGDASRHKVHEILPALRDLSGMPEALGFSAPPGLAAEIEAAADAVANPGPFLGFTHGDATPANAFSTPGAVRLTDLETCGFRHVLLDGSYARLRYIHSVWAFRIPEALQRRLLDAYRTELVRGLPEAGDDALFHEGLMACAAAWLGGLWRLYPKVVDGDVRWGRVTNRQRIVAGLEHFAALAGEVDRLPALAEAASRAGEVLTSQWSREALDFPVYPALAVPPARTSEEDAA